MPVTRTGYKANRKSIATKRREYREKLWNTSDVPMTWLIPCSEKQHLQEPMSQARTAAAINQAAH